MLFEMMLFELDAGVGHGGDGVEHSEIPGRVLLQEILERFVAVFEEGVEELGAGDQVAGPMHEHWVGVGHFAQEVGGEFHLGFGAFDHILMF